MAILRNFIFLSCSCLVFLFPASSFSQQMTSSPSALITINPKQPIELVEDKEDVALIDPITYDVNISQPLPVEENVERSKPNHRKARMTNSIKAIKTTINSKDFPNYTSIDSEKGKKN